MLVLIWDCEFYIDVWRPLRFNTSWILKQRQCLVLIIC